MDCVKCGRKVNVHWLGRGDYCSDHFDDAYHEMNHDDKEFEERQEKINRNFHEKEAESKNERLLG